MHAELAPRDTLMVKNEGGVVAEGKAPKDFKGFTYSTEDATITGRKYAAISGNKSQVYRRRRPTNWQDGELGSIKDFEEYYTVDKNGTRVFADGVKFTRTTPAAFDSDKVKMPERVVVEKTPRAPKVPVKFEGSLTEKQIRSKVEKILAGRDGKVTLLLSAQLGKATEPHETKSTLDLNDPMYDARLEDRITNLWAGRVFSIEESVPAAKAEKAVAKLKAAKAGVPAKAGDKTPARPPRLKKAAAK